MLGVDDDTLILIIQLVSLILVAIQSIPQIIKIYVGKEEVVENLSLNSWIYKSGFSIFFVVSLFAGETNAIIVATQTINLLMSLIITSQIFYYSHVEIIPEPITIADAFNEVHEYLIHDKKEIEYNIPVLHNLLKQIYIIFNYKLTPKLLII